MPFLPEWFSGVWLVGGAILQGMLALLCVGHIVLTKRDVRSAAGWAGLVLLVPLVGGVLYYGFGINRIRRRAGRVRQSEALATGYTREMLAARQDLAPLPGEIPLSLHPLAVAGRTLTGMPLEGGNRIDVLEQGDAAYPAMLEAIAGAQSTVFLQTYIFEFDRAGRPFVDALADAQARGVEVRVLVDAVGVRYGRPAIHRVLATRGIPTARFLPSLFPVANPYLNLRNHRKLLLVDGQVAFTGGMNIREGHWLGLDPPPRYLVQDTHFRVAGPVVRQLMTTAAFDWQFVTRERLDGPGWFPDLPPAGRTVARALPDGPDEDLDVLQLAILGAVARADRTIRIATPYFLPDLTLLDALRVAALRGVRVDLLLPERNNLRLVQWASTPRLSDLLSWGCRVWYGLPPFDHTKVLVVDGAWSLIGSANLDPRSLRLNFECNLECYDPALAGQLERLVGDRMASGRRITVEELARRPLPVRLRDGLAWLASPYL